MNMKNRYRAFRRGWGVYYYEDTQTGKQESLATTNKQEALRLVHAKNEGEQHPAFSLHLARVYWKAGDPAAGTRTWQFVMEQIIKTKQQNSRLSFSHSWARLKHPQGWPGKIREVLAEETLLCERMAQLSLSGRQHEHGFGGCAQNGA